MEILKRAVFALCILLLMSTALFAGTCWNGGSSGIAPWEVLNGDGGSPSCAYTDVNYCVNTVASAGDTVLVPAGSAPWDSPLIVNKGLTLCGAGIGNTVITSNITDQNAGIIKYEPSFPALNEPFRITGFTLDCNNKSIGIYLKNYTATIINQIRIDHNRIIKPGGKYTGRAIIIYGTVYGVIDNNTIEYGTAKAIDSYGANAISWDNLSRDFGNANNIYYEDNTIIGNNTPHSAGHGGRYVCRYNSYSGTGGNLCPMFDMHGNQSAGYGTMVGELYHNTIDMSVLYGGYLLAHRGCQAMVFSNRVINAGQGVGSIVREECEDALYPPEGYDNGSVNDLYVMHETSGVWGTNELVGQTIYNTSDYSHGIITSNTNITVTCAAGLTGGMENDWDSGDGWRINLITHKQHVTNSYYWDNTKNGLTPIKEPSNHVTSGSATGGGNDYLDDSGANFTFCASECKIYGICLTSGTGVGQCRRLSSITPTRITVISAWDTNPTSGTRYRIEDDSCDAVAKNSEFWNYDSSFDGTTGIGIGLYAAMPATCTTGVGYWATDKGGNWNTINGTANDGCLYKCTATNTWTLYYTPYTYPHPLRRLSSPQNLQIVSP